ncbi:3'-5' exonuclease domain-containing protein 2 [Echinicola strongylocentroti]|uniref:3'-5' exonuclease domain-containing protein 2 n=1 Tax=Echinicola strongylocentroti TaxID=1795355 RepID=A0A2Z4IP43_9BACT|nr:3'-5' exonuclease [Echinicola strongylocentroti]AWW32316.1 3'-5' exonuclease domain-containing protein 2 [Echinicola strongylocentroti]
MIPYKISKDEVNELPLGHFEGDIVLIEDEKLVPEAVEELSKYSKIGFDTETRPSFRKGVHHEVSLLQLSTPEKAFLFRLNHVGFPSSVRRILEDPNRVKIGAAVRDDIKALKKLEPSFSQASFFDLNEELKKVGFHNVGVRNLSAMVLNIRISKSEQVSNWEAEELTPKQQLYAATDAWACLEIFNELYRKGYLDNLFSNQSS